MSQLEFDFSEHRYFAHAAKMLAMPDWAYIRWSEGVAYIYTYDHRFSHSFPLDVREVEVYVAEVSWIELTNPTADFRGSNYRRYIHD